MRKQSLILLVLLFLLPTIAEARREPDHIGISKAQEQNMNLPGTMIVRGDAKIWSVNFVAIGTKSAGAWLTLYDEYQGAINEANIIMEIEIASAGNSEVVVLNYPIDVSNGLFAIGENGTYVILYE